MRLSPITENPDPRRKRTEPLSDKSQTLGKQAAQGVSGFPPPRQRWMGIDPGLRHTGWAVLEIDPTNQAIQFIAAGSVNPPTKDPAASRLAKLYRTLNALIAHHNPAFTALEKIYINSNPQSSLHLGAARGAILTAIGQHNLSVQEVSPTEVKKAVTGSGRADKDQLERMIRLIIKEIPPTLTADSIDALAIGLCAANLRTHSAVERTPENNP